MHLSVVSIYYISFQVIVFYTIELLVITNGKGSLNPKGTFGTLNGDYDMNCNLYY